MRHDAIRASLAALQEGGFIRSWWAYTPGDRRGKRWLVNTAGGEVKLTTREAETFIRGAKTILFDPRVVVALTADGIPFAVVLVKSGATIARFSDRVTAERFASDFPRVSDSVSNTCAVET
jgi:hypothetical protein